MKKSFKFYRTMTIVIIAFFMLLFIPTLVLDWSGNTCTYVLANCEKFCQAFDGLWGITVTIVIFILELAKDYDYGITLKRIVNIVFGKGILALGGIIFFLLYVVAHVCCNIGFAMMVLLCWIICFLGLIMVLMVAFHLMRRKNIYEILIQKTKTELQDIESPVLQNEGCYSIKSKLDTLSIVDIINHIDLENAKEAQYLLQILQEMFCSMYMEEEKPEKKRCDRLCKRSWGNHIVLTNAMKKIIYRVGMETEYQRQQLIDFVEQLCDRIFSDESMEPVGKLSAIIQLLIPFTESEKEESTKILLRLWKSTSVLCRNVMPDADGNILIYLLLYAEFRYWTWNKKIQNWVLCDDWELHKEIQRILEGDTWWDISFALELWNEWSDYGRQRSRLPLCQFFHFSNGIEGIRNGKEESRWVYVLNYLMLTRR